jgi:hypothetical protein
VAGLEVHLVTPEREVWTGEADFLVARAVDGDLGVLPWPPWTSARSSSTPAATAPRWWSTAASSTSPTRTT